MPPLSLRADIVPKGFNEENRTVELIFSTGAAVERYDWMTGKRYLETLSLEPGSVRLDRLNSGGPLLDSHSAWSVADQLGGVVPGTVRLADKEARATVRFSKREAVEPVWRDVLDGIIRSVSVGYRVYSFEETSGNGNKLPVRKAIDWEPFEISMVPIPADAGAKVRGQSIETNPCKIVQARQEKSMDREDERADSIVEADPLAPPPADPSPAEPNERDEAAAAERKRIQGILLACRAGRQPQSLADRLIADNVTLEDAQSQVFRELERRDVDVPRGGSRPPDVRVTGEDPFVHVRKGMENALLHRFHPWTKSKDNGVEREAGFKLEEIGRPYSGMKPLRMAEVFLSSGRRMRTSGLSQMEIASMALGLDIRAGMHTTSDFAQLLADVMNKTLRQAYEESPQTFGPITRRTTAADFKLIRRLQLGEAPALVKVEEHGEFTHGTMGEGKEEYALATYGRVFAITRKALINDDTDAFGRVPVAFGRQARNLESDLLWQQITTNPNMGDGVALFNTATHGNLAAAGGAIDVTTIGVGRATMRKQKGLDAATVLNLKPLFLIVPAEKETIADQFVNPIQPQEAGKVNPFAGKLSVIAEPRLDTNSLTAWYLAADPMQIDIFELAFLEGEMGPVVESRVGFDVDGLEIKARHDVAAKAIDWRGLYKNPGA